MVIDPIPIFYGVCTLTALVLAMLSGKQDLIRLGLLLLTAWTVCNLIVLAHGYVKAPVLIPTFDAILALLTAGIALFHQSKPALMVFGLFVLIEMVHVAAFEAHTQGSYFYFLALNVLFLLQVVVVGGVGGWSYIHRRVHSGGGFARPGARRG